MSDTRSWYCYQFKKGNKVLHGGITKNSTRREGEHQRNIEPSGHLKLVGNAKTEKGARQWEKDNGYS